MKAHSSKYLTAAHCSMALATTALQGLLPHSADGCTHHISGKVSQEGRSIPFTVGLEKQALIPSFILSSPNHTTSSRTVQPKPVFYSVKTNKLSLSPQKQQFTMLLPFPIPRSTVNIKNNNNNHFILVMAA